MAEGRDRADWNRAAAIRHTIASTWSSSRRSISYYNPYHSDDKASTGVSLDPTKPADMEILALAWVPKYREHKQRNQL